MRYRSREGYEEKGCEREEMSGRSGKTDEVCFDKVRGGFGVSEEGKAEAFRVTCRNEGKREGTGRVLVR
jgi:hypothetical protein